MNIKDFRIKDLLNLKGDRVYDMILDIFLTVSEVKQVYEIPSEDAPPYEPKWVIHIITNSGLLYKDKILPYNKDKCFLVSQLLRTKPIFFMEESEILEGLLENDYNVLKQVSSKERIRLAMKYNKEVMAEAHSNQEIATGRFVEWSSIVPMKGHLEAIRHLKKVVLLKDKSGKRSFYPIDMDWKLK